MLIQALRAALAALVRPRHEDVGATSFWGAVFMAKQLCFKQPMHGELTNKAHHWVCH